MKSCLLLSFIAFIQVAVVDAQEWVRQNPFPELAQINAIDFDGDIGLAVGRESVILYTEDGGEIWEQQLAPIPGWVMMEAAIVPGTNGQVMFAGGNGLLKTEDGGLTWEVISQAVSNIFKIQIFNENDIIALAFDGGLRSNDGMETWEVFDLADNGSGAAHFTDFNNGWCEAGSFNNVQIHRTTNGGLQWEVADTSRHPVINAIHMFDTQNGYMASRDWILRTSNGGTSWDTLHADPLPSTTSMHVANNDEIWVGLNNGFIFYTMDAGQNWTQQNPNIVNSNRIGGIFAKPGGECWAGGKFVTIQYTDDFGASWIDQIPGVKHTLVDVQFLDADNGFAAGLDGSVLRTRDGGAVWADIGLGNPDLTPFALSVLDQANVWLGTTNGELRLSTDGGDNWQIVADSLGSINGLYAFDLNTIVLVNGSGEIWRSNDGAATWTMTYQATSSLLDVTFVGLNGWAVGRNGLILFSPDGGNTWLEQLANGVAQLEDVEFIDGLTGWVTASNFGDTLWLTTDGGQTWDKTLLPFRSFWTGISFMDRDTGWICFGSSGSGRIYKTRDGGLAWEATQFNPEALQAIYAVKGEEVVYSVGAGGNIVKYSQCNFDPTVDNLSGDPTPCVGDTLTYSVQSQYVAFFDWSIPADWSIFGNPNTADLQVIVGQDVGMVSFTGRDACDVSTEELSLTVEPILAPEVMISDMDGTLIVDEPGSLYAWYRDGELIPGANDESYSPTATGTYFVVVTFDSGCSVNSNSIMVVTSSAHGPKARHLTLYPNPATNKIYISSERDFTGARLQMFDVLGHRVLAATVSGQTVGGIDLQPGIYLVQVQHADDYFVARLKISE